jgi:hypothetical protein
VFIKFCRTGTTGGGTTSAVKKSDQAVVRLIA